MSTGFAYGATLWVQIPAQTAQVVPDWATAVTIVSPSGILTWLDALLVAVGTCTGNYQPRPARGVYLRTARDAARVLFHRSKA